MPPTVGKLSGSTSGSAANAAGGVIVKLAASAGMFGVTTAPARNTSPSDKTPGRAGERGKRGRSDNERLSRTCRGFGRPTALTRTRPA